MHAVSGEDVQQRELHRQQKQEWRRSPYCVELQVQVQVQTFKLYDIDSEMGMQRFNRLSSSFKSGSVRHTISLYAAEHEERVRPQQAARVYRNSCLYTSTVPVKDYIAVFTGKLGKCTEYLIERSARGFTGVATISASPASVPPIKSATVSSFRSVPATPNPAPNGKSAGSSAQAPTSATTQAKFDVKKLFQNPGSTPAASSAQPSQMAHTPYSHFVSGTGLRPQQNGAPFAQDTVVAAPDAPRKRHPGPPDLSSTRNQPISQPLPSALATARIIEDLGSVSYPRGIKSPKVELNVNAKHGKFRYDRDFLMQFMKICKDKPDNLPPLDAIGLEPSEQGTGIPMSRGGSQRRSSTAMGPPPSNAARQLQGLGLSNFNGAKGNFNMGNFATQSMKTSEERFKESQMGRSTSMTSGPPGVGIPFGGGRSSPMVRSLLNKLTMERFDSISDQIIAWANKEQDGRTLIQVIRLVFEKATDEAAWSEMYARLCRKMMEQISPKVQDEGIKNAEGKPIAGGQLFRKYLLNRCQEDFEHGWAAKENTAAAAATKATEDEAAKAAAEKDEDGEAALYSEEYYAAQKAKRQGLGLIKFIGELFKLQMLTERIMHECVKKLLGNVENPEEEEIESLCKLLTTVGQLLDTPKARVHLDVYFTRMKELVKNPKVNSRMQFMLLDLIQLRDRKWVPRNQVAGPTISAVRTQAMKETAVEGKDHWQRTLSTSSVRSRAPPKSGDLSQFGNISKANASLARGSNMFSKPIENPEIAAEAAIATSSRPTSWKPSIYLGTAGESWAPSQCRKLYLLSRVLSVPDRTGAESAYATPQARRADNEESAAPSISEAEARMRIGDAKEFFNIRDLDEAEHYFHELPSRHRWLLVDRLVISAVTNSNEADAQFVSDFFSRAVLKNLCSPEQFEKGFLPTAEVLDAIDVPKAFNLMATMMKGAQLDGERWARVARRSMGSQADRLLPASAKSTSEDVVPTSSIPPSRGFNEPDEPLMFEEQVKLQLRIEVEQFFKVRDLDMGETGLRGLPSAHRWRLVSNLVLFATLSGTKDARLVGNLLSRAAEKGLCSPEAFELAFSPVMDGLDVFTSHNPTAFILIAIMLKAAQLDRERLSRLVSSSPSAAVATNLFILYE
ncbi:hypothetical protein DAEQUDRAFT_755150 [Daedalea quercina L-15889]|uniref:MIF4G domain-containing protein n=1 Tax=Daedalea quercina L-15889 TaxID=1314783 RepID=A0A165SP97_9APHY|nr:hypothetical protein DAEQUDRAFT_755150 [Daedalea quercina L-15889]